MVIRGSCIEALAAMLEASVDAIVTDPPYGLGFMGREWDALPPGLEWARACLRVLKPGGHLLAFGGTRTSHRLVCAVEDAGFEIRDTIAWLYGSGFPKSHNLHGDWAGWGTALKPAHEPIVVARKPLDGTVAACVVRNGTGALNVDECRVDLNGDRKTAHGTAGDNPDKAQLHGGGIVERSLTDNTLGRWPSNLVLSHSPGCQPAGTRRVKGITGGTGNHDGGVYGARSNQGDAVHDYADADGTEEVATYRCVEDCPVRLLDEQTGTLTSGSGQRRPTEWQSVNAYGFSERPNGASDYQRNGDSGGASRFFPTFDHRHEDTERRAFYCAKSSSAERNAGLDGFEERSNAPYNERPSGQLNAHLHGADPPPRANVHPTVKPIALMRWLVRLVTPPGGLVLDPFAGSGTTGIAAVLEGFDFIGIERETEYVAIAQARIAWWAKHPDGMTLVKRLEAEKAQATVAESGQASLFDTVATPATGCYDRPHG